MARARDYEDARLRVLLGAYLHDVGNAIHRIDHEKTGVLLASNLLDRVLLDLYDSDPGLAYRVKSEVLLALYSSDDSIPCRARIFQIEEVIGKKIRSSGIGGNSWRSLPP